MSILRRTVFYEKKDRGQFRFTGWAHTVTTLGACAEPFNINDRTVPDQSIRDFDPSDPIARVDILQNVDNPFIELSFGENPPIHGGNMMPRVKIATGNF